MVASHAFHGQVGNKCEKPTGPYGSPSAHTLLMELRAAGWKGVDAMIKGARPEILDGSVKRILMEEAKRGHGCIE